jgi:hypothetical protein
VKVGTVGRTPAIADAAHSIPVVPHRATGETVLVKSERVCILASMGWGVRNVLMSRAINAMMDRCEIHVLSVFHDLETFRRHFSHLDSLAALGRVPKDRALRLLYHLNTNIFYNLSPSLTHQYKLKRVPKRRLARIVHHLARWVASERTLRMTRDMLARRLRTTPAYAQAIEAFRQRGITTVVASNPLNLTEYPALIAAKDLGLRTVAIITSWDNLSSKRPLVIEFDEYGVWNEIMAEEVKAFYGITEDRLHRLGPLQFDFYFEDRLIESREAFCRRFHFDPARKIIVHSTVTGGLMPDEPELITELLLAVRDGRIAGQPNVLVRLHPKRAIEAFASVMVDPRFHGMRIGWTEAGRPVRSEEDRWCPLEEEISLLANTVRHGDVNLNVFSTMLLDFAVCGKPAVLIGHTATDGRLHYAEYEHIKPVLECGGHHVCYSLEETIHSTNAYLKDPSLHAEGRRRLLDLQCGPHLGRSWERIPKMILGTNGQVRHGDAAWAPAEALGTDSNGCVIEIPATMRTRAAL